MLRVVLLALATALIAIIARRTERSLAAPVAVFALMWGGYLLAAALFIVDVERILNGMLWIWLSVLVLYAGTLVAHPFSAGWHQGASGLTKPLDFDRIVGPLRWLSLSMVLAGIPALAEPFLVRGLSVAEILSWAVLTQISAQSHAALTGGEIETSIGLRLVFVALFLATLYGGILFRLSTKPTDRFISLCTLAMISLVYTIYGSRMGVLYGGSFWLASYLAAHVYMSGDGPNSDRVLIGVGTAAVGLLIGVSTLTMVVRYTATQSLDWHRMLADPFAFVAAFGIWFDQSGLHANDLFFGARTFRRPFELVGMSYELYPAIDVGFTTSNIYTVFRDLLEDFGSVGALAVMFFYGMAGRLAFAAVVARHPHALTWLTFAYAFAITSVASGMLSYTTPIAALILFFFSYWIMDSTSKSSLPLREPI